MAHPHPRPAQIPAKGAEGRTSVDELIRPGLRRAYPSPPKGETHDEQFGRLLDALARTRDRTK